MPDDEIYLLSSAPRGFLAFRANTIVQASLHQAEPVQAEPVQAEPVQAEPVQAEPLIDLLARLGLEKPDDSRDLLFAGHRFHVGSGLHLSSAIRRLELPPFLEGAWSDLGVDGLVICEAGVALSFNLEHLATLPR